jgi:hypothetical protein
MKNLVLQRLIQTIVFQVLPEFNVAKKEGIPLEN